jgi:hypothetical protein
MIFQVPAFAILLLLASCVTRVVVPSDPKCPTWLPLRQQAINEITAKHFLRASELAEKSVRVRFACDRSGVEPLSPAAQAAAAHDLLRAGELAHLGGDVRRGRTLVGASLHEFSVALSRRHAPGDWVADAHDDMTQAESNLRFDEWPVFDYPNPELR